MDAAGAGGGAGPDEALQGLLNLGINLEELLLSLSQELPDSAEEFGRAKDLIKVGIAKVLVAAGGSPNGGPLPSNGPTESGKQFPAAGFNSPPSLNFG